MPGLALLARARTRRRRHPADGPGRIEGVHRIGDPGRDRAGPDPRGGRTGQPPARAGRNAGPVSRPRGRRARCLSRIHRHDLGRDPGRARRFRDEAALRAALAERGVGMSRPLGFDDTYAIGMREQEAARLGLSHSLRPAPTSRPEVWVQQRIHGSIRRLAGHPRPLRLTPARCPRSRPRPRLSRPRQRRDPGHRPLLDRRRDQAVQPPRAPRRPQLLPLVRMRLALSGRFAVAIARGLRRPDAAGRTDHLGRDGRR